MAGYKETFGSNVDYAYSRGVTDVTGRLERSVAQLGSMGGALGRFRSEAKAASSNIRKLNDDIKGLEDARLDAIFAGNTQAVERLNRQLAETKRRLIDIKKARIDIPLKAAEMGFAKLTKGLIGLNASILGISFGFLIDSIKRVYELQERWTKAIGGFNMKLGGMTAGLKGAQRAATQWSSTIRGLTNGDIFEGIEMFGEFTMAVGRTIKAGDDFSKFGLQMARGFNLGAQGAGQLVKVFSNLEMNADDSAESMKILIKSANAAGIPTNMLAGDLKEASVYMARFGKEGQRMFIQGAAYARKFTISIEQLRNAVEGLDMFDEAAKTASKLNTAFGTMINSMDLMMEDDPAKRLEMIRQQFLAQGQTFDKLTPKQRRYLAESLKLTEDQTAALLAQSKAGESYEAFQKKAEASAKREASAKQMMEKQLRATVQTMYAFGAAFDRITLAIAKAIRPLLEVLGLAKSGDKEWKSFGNVMESITTTVEAFFVSLSKNQKWMGFMRTLAGDLKRAAGALKDFVLDGGAAKLVGRLAENMQRFYTWVRDLGLSAAKYLDPVVSAFFWLSKHLGVIASIWAGLKITNMVGGGNIAEAFGMIKGGKTTGGRAAGIRGGVGAAAGLGAGALLGGGGAMAGGALGGLVGSFMGPLGQALGPIAGALLGKGLDMLTGLFESKSDLQIAREKLEETITRETKKREIMNGILEATQQRQAAEDSARVARNRLLQGMEKTALSQKDKSIILTDAEAVMLQQRAKELSMFGKTSREAKSLLDKLGAGSKLTAAQLQMLVKGSQEYGNELEKLRGLAKQQADIETAKLESGKVAREKSALESLTKFRDMELRLGRDQLKDMNKGSRLESMRSFGTLQNVSAAQLLASKEDLKLNKKEIEALKLEEKLNKLEEANLKDQRRLQELQTDFLKESIGIQLRQSVMGSSEFLQFSSGAGMAGKSLDERFRAFLGTDDARALVGGQTGLDLLRGGPDIGAIVSSAQANSSRVSAGPSQVANRFIQSGGFSSAGRSSSAVPAINLTVNVDGTPLSRQQVRSSLQR